MAQWDIDTRPVGPGELTDLAALFESERNTRRCLCMAFCSSRTQFGPGWLTGGNRDRFEAMARESAAPMGILASTSGQVVGWCACGPRSRYAVAEKGRSRILRDRRRDEDDAVWLLACLFVRAEYRERGVTHALMRAAVELGRSEGARAVEGWPVAASERRTPNTFLGREEAFRALGFSCVGRPDPQRALMRLELT